MTLAVMEFVVLNLPPPRTVWPLEDNYCHTYGWLPTGKSWRMRTMSDHSADSNPRMSAKEIDAVLSSIMRPWGPLGLLDGAAEDHRPGDWWPAFWWTMENKWVAKQSDVHDCCPQESETEQTRLVTDGGTSSDSTKHAEQSLPYEWRAVKFGGNKLVVRSIPEGTAEAFLVTAETINVRSLAQADAVVYEGTVVEPEYDEDIHAVVFYHDYAGKMASHRCEEFLDEPAIRLKRLPTASLGGDGA